MKRIILAVFVGSALAACGSGEADNTEADPRALDASATDTAAASDVTGTYEVTTSDGTVIRQTINSDGTYIDTAADGTVNERGSWYQDGQQMCFDPEGSDPESCYDGGTVSADDNLNIRERGGNFTSSVRKLDNDTSAGAASRE